MTDKAELGSCLPGGGRWQKAVCDLSAVVQMDYMYSRAPDLHVCSVEGVPDARREDQVFLTHSGKRSKGIKG